MNQLIGDKNRKKSLFIALIMGVIICVLFATSKFSNIVAFSYLGFAICLVSAVVLNSTSNVMLSFFLMPNTGYMSVEGNAAIGYMIMLIVIKMCYEQKKIPDLKLMGLLFITGIVLSYASLSNGWPNNILSYIKVVFYFALMYFISASSKNNYSIIAKCFVYGSFVCCLFGLFYKVSNGMSIFYVDRFGRFSSLSGDPNYFSAILVFSIALIFYLLYFGQIKFVLAFPVFVVLLYSSLSSLSRGSLLSLGLICFFGFISFLLSKQVKFIYKIVFVVSLIFACLALVRYTNIVNMFLNRLESVSFETGNGRLDIWEWYFKRILNSGSKLMFGFGSAHIAVENGLIKYIEHNTYLQILYEIGLVGSIFYVLSFLRFVKESKTKNSFNWNHIIVKATPLLGVLAPYLFISQMYGENFVIPLLFSTLLIFKTDLNGKFKTSH